MISLCNQAEIMTKQVIGDFYHQNSENIIRKLEPNVTWIGDADGQCMNGHRDVSEYIRNIEVPMCEVFSQNYHAVEASADIFIVTGWLVVTVPADQEVVSAVQRVTFVWKGTYDKLNILHIHISNYIDFQKKDEYFPLPAEKETFRYMKQILEQKQDRLITQGKHNQTYVIWIKEILYMEAVNTDCVIHCLNREILSKESISDMEKKIGEDFIKIHRSFIVNSKYITSIDRYHLVVRQETKLPIPQKKYREIKEKVLSIVS